jgi:hypothetical protein
MTEAATNPTSPDVGSGFPVPSGGDDPAVETVTESELRLAESGKVTIELGDEKSRILLPVNAATVLGRNNLVIHTRGAEFLISVEILRKAAELFKDHQLIIVLKRSEVSTPLPLGSLIYGLELKLKGYSGKETDVLSFAEPVKMRLSVDTSKVNPDLVGIYRFNTLTASWDFVRNKFDRTNLEAAFDADKPGLYAAMEYDKTFSDVPASHWVYSTLKVLSAQHLVAGATDSEFKPVAPTTRAEFTALLVRVLGLEIGTEKVEGYFTDVKEQDWYAKYVEAAYSAGLVQGKSSHFFDPKGIMTREQMALMLTNAYELSGRIIPEDTALQTYTDGRNVSKWAESSVNKAIASGLMHGQTAREFVPKASATHAEAVQAIYNFIQIIE